MASTTRARQRSLISFLRRSLSCPRSDETLHGLAGAVQSIICLAAIRKILKTKIYGCDKRYLCPMKTKGQLGLAGISTTKNESKGFDLLMPDWCVGYASKGTVSDCDSIRPPDNPASPRSFRSIHETLRAGFYLVLSVGNNIFTLFIRTRTQSIVSFNKSGVHRLIQSS